jgi:hypothetical protein
MDVSPKVQRDVDPTGYKASTEVTVGDNKNVTPVQTFLFVLPVIFTNLQVKVVNRTNVDSIIISPW